MTNGESNGRPQVRFGQTAGECWTTVRSVVDVWALAAGCVAAPAAAPAPPPPPPPPPVWHRPKCA